MARRNRESNETLVQVLGRGWGRGWGLGRLQTAISRNTVGALSASMCVGGLSASALAMVGAPPPVIAPPYFEDESTLALCGQWVKESLLIVSEDATCPCRRYTPEGGGCDLLPVTLSGHPAASANGNYWRLRVQRCEESVVTLSDDLDSGTTGAFKLITTSGVYQNPVPDWTYGFAPNAEGGLTPIKLATDPMACCPSCIGDSESIGGPCHTNGKLVRRIIYLPPSDGGPDMFQRWMRITANATIKLDARLNRLGCVGTGSATVSGRSEVTLMQNLTSQDIGVLRKFPATIAGERTFDFSGATTSGAAGFKLKLGLNPEVEIGFTASGTLPADGDLRIIRKTEVIRWQSELFCKAPPALPPSAPYAEFVVELTGDVISRALLATGRESECKTQVHLHDVDVSFGECVLCYENDAPNGPIQHNP